MSAGNNTTESAPKEYSRVQGIYSLVDFIDDLRFGRDLPTGRKYCFVLGSGASVASGIMSGQELVTVWVREIFRRECPSVGRRLVEIRQRLLGPTHPETLESLNDFALLLDDKGDYEAAEPIYRAALDGYERAFGKDHPDTLTVQNNLAILLAARGQYELAEPLERYALESREKLLGPSHFDTLQSLAGLALAIFRTTLESSESVWGPEHFYTANIVSRLASLLARKDDFSGAENLLRHAIENAETALGKDSPIVVRYKTELQSLLSESPQRQ
jgi:tetratricopeptide (TPR) repeat protein